MEDDPEYAQQQWARNQKEMQQADEVSIVCIPSWICSSTQTREVGSARVGAARGDGLGRGEEEAMNKDEQIQQAMAADKDVFQMFRTKSDADLAEVGLRRVDSANGTPDGTPEK